MGSREESLNDSGNTPGDCSGNVSCYPLRQLNLPVLVLIARAPARSTLLFRFLVEVWWLLVFFALRAHRDGPVADVELVLALTGGVLVGLLEGVVGVVEDVPLLAVLVVVFPAVSRLVVSVATVRRTFRLWSFDSVS